MQSGNNTDYVFKQWVDDFIWGWIGLGQPRDIGQSCYDAIFMPRASYATKTRPSTT